LWTLGLGSATEPYPVTSLAVGDFETIRYEASDGVAWVTLDRPDKHNAFNALMQAELKALWRSLQTDDEVRCVVLTGAGEKAFCVGIDRDETMGHWEDDAQAAGQAGGRVGGVNLPFNFDDPGDDLGPRSNELWKPVIAAVNGMACGGAFYLLGEVDFVIAADHATFFDPHVTYGMPTVYEPIHMLGKMPFHEIMRISLLGNHERMSAERAHQIGLVSEVAPAADLRDTAQWAAAAIASAPPNAIEATVRALWMARELTRQQALDLAAPIMRHGTDADVSLEGQKAFSSGARIEPRTR
jgi:enoyl-CoA hydratase/carnithine racemase